MAISRLTAKVEADPGDPESFLVGAPAVGVARGLPAAGAHVNPNEILFWLEILGRRHAVRLPRHAGGVVSELLVPEATAPVGYGQPLLRLSRAEARATHRDRTAVGATVAAESDLIAVAAPSDGVFYRRPTPDSPPYVEEGSTVALGSVLGLVEVMKSFSQITYGGPDLPERGTVARVLVEDGTEVAFRQTLFLIRPS